MRSCKTHTRSPNVLRIRECRVQNRKSSDFCSLGFGGRIRLDVWMECIVTEVRFNLRSISERIMAAGLLQPSKGGKENKTQGTCVSVTEWGEGRQWDERERIESGNGNMGSMRLVPVCLFVRSCARIEKTSRFKDGTAAAAFRHQLQSPLRDPSRRRLVQSDGRHFLSPGLSVKRQPKDVLNLILFK